PHARQPGHARRHVRPPARGLHVPGRACVPRQVRWRMRRARRLPARAAQGEPGPFAAPDGLAEPAGLASLTTTASFSADRPATIGAAAVLSTPYARCAARAARPDRLVRPGDASGITRGDGRRLSVVVRATAAHHVPKAEARRLYEDRTPPPSPEEIEIRRFDRAMRAADPPGAPYRRDRRLLRRLKGRSD